MKRVLAIGLAVIFLASAALASAFYRNLNGAGQGAGQTLTEVKVCPMNGEVLSDISSAPSEVVGSYKVYFCCAHHKEAFGKLSQQEKEQKIAKALEKQNKGKS